ncbi:Exonuclease mut-7 [Manis javanica]|nr:Exonuclease mut-7 [Manis javanica]
MNQNVEMHLAAVVFVVWGKDIGMNKNAFIQQCKCKVFWERQYAVGFGKQRSSFTYVVERFLLTLHEVGIHVSLYRCININCQSACHTDSQEVLRIFVERITGRDGHERVPSPLAGPRRNLPLPFTMSARWDSWWDEAIAYP